MGLDNYACNGLRSSMCLFKRFVDDIFIVAAQYITLQAILDLLNAWDSGIIVTDDPSEQGDSTTFLDLAIAVTARGIHYKTYRKPLCSYAYLPIHSSHA